MRRAFLQEMTFPKPRLGGTSPKYETPIGRAISTFGSVKKEAPGVTFIRSVPVMIPGSGVSVVLVTVFVAVHVDVSDSVAVSVVCVHVVEVKVWVVTVVEL
mmetsp:Transcript_93497/g.166354  ORF Transcript_93497/g.166354 Transcript_93497/m.166354 type:complete len:101 (+) Transcript_93497:388-690(+)